MFSPHKGQLVLASLLVLGLTLNAGSRTRNDRADAEMPVRTELAHQPTAHPADPAVAKQTDHSDYMPLHSGRSLTYRTVDGDRFTLTFSVPRTVRWFDGTAMQVVPVHDTRCRCHILFMEKDGQVRAVGSLEGKEISRWGEYIVVFPGADAAAREPVVTPAGRFEQAVRVETTEGTTWFSPGIGIVRTHHYELLSAERFY